MARPPKGKPLTMRTVRLDDDVWAECQRLGKEHGTINEGLRTRLMTATHPLAEISGLLEGHPLADEYLKTVAPEAEARRVMKRVGESREVRHARKVLMRTRRGPRPKGDKTR